MSLWIYTLGLLLWRGLNYWFGDRVWWIALLSPFAPAFFVPFLPLIVLTLIDTDWTIPNLAGWLAPVPLIAAVGWSTFGKQIGQGKQQAEQKTEKANGGTIVELMTFNIWWRSQQSTTAHVPLESNSPHIALFQELTPLMASKLENELGQHYPYRIFSTADSHVEGHAGNHNPSRLGIISKYPIEILDNSHLSSKDFRIQIGRVTLPQSQKHSTRKEKNPSISNTQKTVLVYNIHPRATNAIRYWHEEGSFTRKVRCSFANRIGFFQRMIDDIESRQEPVVVAGDFNSTPLSDVYKLMSRHLIDLHTASGHGLGHTFPAHRGDLQRLPVPLRVMRLDMIFCTPELVVLECKVGANHGESDHLPVIATIQVT